MYISLNDCWWVFPFATVLEPFCVFTRGTKALGQWVQQAWPWFSWSGRAGAQGPLWGGCLFLCSFVLWLSFVRLTTAIDTIAEFCDHMPIVVRWKFQLLLVVWSLCSYASCLSVWVAVSEYWVTVSIVWLVVLHKYICNLMWSMFVCWCVLKTKRKTHFTIEHNVTLSCYNIMTVMLSLCILEYG